MADQEKTDFGRAHDLTVEEVKACAAFTHFTDEEAQHVIEALKAFTKIAYDYYKNQHKPL